MPEVEDDEAAGACGCGEVVSQVGEEGGEIFQRFLRLERGRLVFDGKCDKKYGDNAHNSDISVIVNISVTPHTSPIYPKIAHKSHYGCGRTIQ